MTNATDISVATDDFDTMGGRLVRARESAGMSTEVLAERIGVTLETLEEWEADRAEPRANRLTMLAGILGVSPTWLLFGRGTAPDEGDSIGDLESIRTQLSVLRDLHQKTGESIRVLEEALRRRETEAA